MNPYHYTECGLDNIIIEADLIAIEDKGEKIVTIPAIGQLHNIIAQGLVAQENALSGTEIRFLRTEMGMTQAELAQLLHRDTQTVGRWERGEVALDATQDIFIRQLAAEKLQLFIEKSVERQSRKVTPKAYREPIHIQLTKNKKAPYKLVA